jgi:hypothetical protein
VVYRIQKNPRLRMLVVYLDRLASYQCAARDECTEQRKNPDPQEDVTSRAPGRKRNGDTPLGCSGRTAVRREKCDKMPETGTVESDFRLIS